LINVLAGSSAIQGIVREAGFTASGVFNCTWSVVAGLRYQVHYKTNLLQANWMNLGSPVPATNTSLAVSDANAVNSPQRFYRLIVSP
jgi:hypothetical protein